MIYLLRHGQTDWNIIHKLQGASDIPLNETGRQMAIDASEKYKDIDFECCYCSPLIRAKETAELFLGKRDISIIYDERLKEMHFGPYEGTESPVDHVNHPLHVFFTDPSAYVPVEHVESFDEMYKRTRECMEEILSKHNYKKNNILIVGHGAMCSGIICQYEGIQLKDFWTTLMKNCELYPLRIDENRVN